VESDRQVGDEAHESEVRGGLAMTAIHAPLRQLFEEVMS
jgi:hypothetical protein